MEERVLVKSKRHHIGVILLVIALTVTVFFLWQFLSMHTKYFNRVISQCSACKHFGHICDMHRFGGGGYAQATAYAWEYSGGVFVKFICIGIPVIALCLLVHVWMRSYELTVTDKRVYGIVAFGKRVDLPIDSVSAVGTGWFKGIFVSTSSGKISFLLMKNKDEIHKCISSLLIERQAKVTTPVTTTIKQEIPQSNADELKKYKELLDQGVITQEEFDAKKKQLLDL